MAKTVNEALLDAAILQSIRTVRFQNSESKKIIKKLFESDRELRLLLNSEDLTGFTTQRGRVLRRKVRDLLRSFHGEELKPAIISAVDGIAIVSSNAEAAAITQAVAAVLNVTTPNTDLIRQAVRRRPFNGGILSSWLTQLERNDVDRIWRRILQGMTDGETTEAIVQGVLGTRSLAYRDGIRHVTRSGTALLTRTAINHATNAGRHLLWEQNADILKGYKWVSTLDSRTSDICRFRDGMIWKISRGPLPPAHPDCRSTTVPIVKSWQQLGIPSHELNVGTRSALNGVVPANVTYNEWLVTQSDIVIREALGPARFKLWKAGDVDIGDFINDKGIRLTLDELEALV
jgi:SPP1 gp7 family putative phage head morphogenesis protein